MTDAAYNDDENTVSPQNLTIPILTLLEVSNIVLTRFFALSNKMDFLDFPSAVLKSMLPELSITKIISVLLKLDISFLVFDNFNSIVTSPVFAFESTIVLEI